MHIRAHDRIIFTVADMAGFVVVPGTNYPLTDKLRETFATRQKWISLARFEIARRYANTGLGPWWSAGSNLAFILAIWAIYTGALDLGSDYYFSHIAIGYLTWTFVSLNISTGMNIFTSNIGLISQMRINYFGIILKWLIVRCIMFSYNIVLLPLIFLLGDLGEIGWAALTVLPAFCLIIINSFCGAYSLSLLTATYRDIPLIIPIFIRFFFFVTPIIWDEARVTSIVRTIIVDFNPFYYVLETVRSPLVEGNIPVLAWVVFIILTIINFVVMAYLYRRYDHRIIYLAM